MNVKISVFVISVEAIIYLLLCNLHDCTFNKFQFISNGNIIRKYLCRDGVHFIEAGIGILAGIDILSTISFSWSICPWVLIFRQTITTLRPYLLPNEIKRKDVTLGSFKSYGQRINVHATYIKLSSFTIYSSFIYFFYSSFE